jgi:hypothetical protein
LKGSKTAALAKTDGAERIAAMPAAPAAAQSAV